MKYCAMNAVGETVGTMFPDLYEDSDDSEDDEMEVVDANECPTFERYSGADPQFIQINEAYDRWDSWVPQNPTEQMLKNAINSNEPMGA